MGFIGKLPGKTPEATMASTLYTDIKKWKDGKPGSLFCRPREGLFGLREWTKDKELSHLVEDADEFFGAGLVARPFSPHDSHSSGGTAFDHGSTGPGAKRRRKSPPAAAERDDNDEDAGLLLLLGAAGDDSNNDDDDTDDARRSDRGAKRAKREDSEADGRGNLAAAAAAAAAGRDASEERAGAPSPAPASAPGASMLMLTVAIADARARGDVRTAETLGAKRREEIVAADAELRDAMLRAGRIVSLNGASAGKTHEAWRQAFAMATARGIDRCEAAMMVLDAEQKAKLTRGEKSKSLRRATAPEETGTGTGTGTDEGDGSRTMGDIIIRALSSSQAQAATAPPGVVADPAPVNSGSGFGSGLGLGPGSAAAASGAESTLAPEAVLAARQHLCALIPLFVNRTMELYAALGPHPTTIQSLLALLALFTHAGRPLEAEETAARLWDTLRAATFPQGLGENPQTLSALRLQYASMVRLATAHPFPMP